MGDESITVPPASNISATSALSGARLPSPAPTSKVCQVPTPTIGRASPDDGIGRVVIGAAHRLAATAPGHAKAAPAAAESARKPRRGSAGPIGSVAPFNRPSPAAYPEPAGPEKRRVPPSASISHSRL